jgi:hypothetical protein
VIAEAHVSQSESVSSGGAGAGGSVDTTR